MWRGEVEQGKTEGRKDRPCAIVLALDGPATAQANKNEQVAVVPITHSPPSDPNVAIEIPPGIKRHLGLDRERSWVILNENECDPVMLGFLSFLQKEMAEDPELIEPADRAQLARIGQVGAEALGIDPHFPRENEARSVTRLCALFHESCMA